MDESLRKFAGNYSIVSTKKRTYRRGAESVEQNVLNKTLSELCELSVSAVK